MAISAAQPSIRCLVGVESRVASGALAKGRSPSKPLNQELQRKLTMTLATDLCYGTLFLPSRRQPAYAPSRGASVRLPSAPRPEWQDDLENGRPEAFLQWARLPTQQRACSEWGRMALHLLQVARIAWPPHRGFDLTLGYPGEGWTLCRCIRLLVVVLGWLAGALAVCSSVPRTVDVRSHARDLHPGGHGGRGSRLPLARGARDHLHLRIGRRRGHGRDRGYLATRRIACRWHFASFA